VSELVLDLYTEYRMKHLEAPDSLWCGANIYRELCRNIDLFVQEGFAMIYGLRVMIIPWYDDNQLKVGRSFLR
jgi:hypothetical protein